MQDIARTRSADARNQRTDVGYGRFERTAHGQDCRFSGLRAAATRHAGWRTRAVILTRLLVAHAGLCNDQAKAPGALTVNNATMIARANRRTAHVQHRAV